MPGFTSIVASQGCCQKPYHFKALTSFAIHSVAARSAYRRQNKCWRSPPYLQPHPHAEQFLCTQRRYSHALPARQSGIRSKSQYRHFCTQTGYADKVPDIAAKTHILFSIIIYPLHILKKRRHRNYCSDALKQILFSLFIEPFFIRKKDSAHDQDQNR